MILTFADHEGDPVAVESAAIVGLSVGSLNGPHAAGADVRVTLIWTTAAQPFMVAASFADVLHRWTLSRGEPATAPRRAHPNAFPLVQHQYPGGAL